MRLGTGWAAVLALAALVPLPAQAAWWQAQSRHFTVYREGNGDKLRDFAERLEKFDYLLRTMTGVTDPERGSPVKVYLLSGDDKVRALARNRNIGGFYATSDRNAFAVLSRGEKQGQFDFGAEEILFHEYTHHFMLHHFPAAYPAWYVEGVAEYFSVVKFHKDGGIQFGLVPMARAPGLVLNAPYPVANLFARNTDGLGLRDGDRYYGTAWLLTHYYLQKKNEARSAEISRYLADVAKGAKDMRPDDYFAGGLAGLEKDLKLYMRQRMTASQLLSKSLPVAAISVTPVDAAQGDLIDDQLRLDCHPREEELPGIVAAIRAVAVRHPDSAHALALLAQAQWAADRKADALADADRAIAIDPTSGRAYAVRAEALLERAQDSDRPEDWKAALSAIVRANRADLEDPVPLALFYRYHAMRGGPMPDLGYDGLYKAFTILPQHPDYRFALSHATAVRGNYRLASALLDPIAHSPHGSGMRDAALKLKADLDAKAQVPEQSPRPAP